MSRGFVRVCARPTPGSSHVTEGPTSPAAPTSQGARSLALAVFLTGSTDGHRGKTAAARASPCWWHWGRGRIWNAGESWEPTWRLTTPARFPFQAGYTKLLPGCPLRLDESCPEPAASACPPMWVPLPALPAPSGHWEMLVCFISGPHDSDNCLSYRWPTACPSHRPQSSVVLWPIQA